MSQDPYYNEQKRKADISSETAPYKEKIRKLKEEKNHTNDPKRLKEIEEQIEYHKQLINQVTNEVNSKAHSN